MASAVKLPLAVKKLIKDQEPEKVKLLARLEKVLGSPYTFDYNFDAAWTMLEGNSDQASLPSVALQYLGEFVTACERNLTDPIVKETVVKYITKKNITFTIEPESWDGHVYKETNPCAWEGYCGARLLDGSFDVFTKIGRFWSNLNHLACIKFPELFKNVKLAAGELPMHLRQELVAEADNVTKVKARIAKALGVDAVQWNLEADALALIGRTDGKLKEYPFSVGMAVNYMNNLGELLEKKCADEMVKEAVNEVFGTKTISIKVYDSLEGLKGLEMHDNYNGVQFLDGQMIVFTPPNNWATNINNLCYTHDLIKLF